MHLLRVLRYVEANPLRAGLVRRAEDWTWCSLSAQDVVRPDLTPWPIASPENWADYVNAPTSEEELTRLRYSVRRGAPYGESQWVDRVAKASGLEFTLRAPGRPCTRDTQPSAK
jgi:putative transposase